MTSLDLCRGGDSIHARKHPRAYITSRKQKKRSTQILPSPKAFRRCFRWQRYEPTVQPICAMEDNYLFFLQKKGKNGGISKKTVSSTKHKDLDELLEKYEGRVLLQHKREGEFLFFLAEDFPGKPEWDSSIPLMEKPT